MSMMSRVENPNVYTDLSGLNAISRAGRESTPEGLRQVAQQFEALFLNMMLKGMRESDAALFKDNYLSSKEMEFHQQNLDNQMSMHLAGAGGIGLADSMYRQMMGRFDVREPANDAAAASLDAGAAIMAATAGKPVPPRRPFVAASTYSPEPVSIAPALPERHIPQPRSVTGAAVHKPAAVPAKRIGSPEEFVQRLLPAARKVADRLGVDPRLLLAQSALETGWGSAMPMKQDGTPSFNLFGVKADSRWNGEQVSVNTLEFRDGVVHREKASFRSYESFEDSFRDYADFLESNPRYAQALQHAGDAESFARHLQQAGYATDPEYAHKVTGVMNSPIMESSLRGTPGAAARPLRVPQSSDEMR